MLKSISVVLLVTLILYLVGAFTNGTWDTVEWDVFGKIMISIGWMSVIAVTAAVYHIRNSSTKRKV